MAGRIPRRLFTGVLPIYTEAAVLLEYEPVQAPKVRESKRRAFPCRLRHSKVGEVPFYQKPKAPLHLENVEAEFQAMLADESIRDGLEITEKAYSFLTEVVARISRNRIDTKMA